jgi:hypothetical protein
VIAGLEVDLSIKRDAVRWQVGRRPCAENDTPLGNYTHLPSRSSEISTYANHENTPDGLKITRDAFRWQARAHGRRELWMHGAGARRAASCGLRLSHGRRGVDVYRCSDGPRGRVSGVCNCGQPLLCAVCSPRISAFRAGECEEGFGRAAARGWKANLLVYTAPHHQGERLLDLVDFWRHAWDQNVGSGREAQKLREQKHGHFGGPELTWTQANGWHFHRNLVVFHDGNLDVQAHHDRWMGCLGSRYSAAAEVHGFHSTPMDSAEMARYCAKQGAEIAWAEGKSSSVTPLSMLVSAAKAGCPCPLWVEAVNVVAARKLSIVRWSRGLRADLGVSPEKSDSRVAEEKGRPSDELLGSLTSTQWRFVVSRRLEYRLLQEAQLGREALECFMHSNGLGDLLSPEQIAGAFPVISETNPYERKYATGSRSEIDSAILNSPV